ncbi:helix-turn-helix domain-containing protein [Aquimarina aquimarini]|uniref:helix-turn-helix domain-containing protein n=1 Tax=Aquimarina aquimarini TaxID=1191734 RepID=UPI00131EF727|nr:AraC family transcriptional regulator [Aquimarina aquimarini]
MACSMRFLGNNIEDFCIYDLHGITKRFPKLRLPRTQDFYSIIYIEKAFGSIVIDEFNISIDSKKILFIKPGSVSRIRIDDDAKGKVICFTEDFFSLRYNSNVLNEFSFIKNYTTPTVDFNECQHKKWVHIMDLLDKEYTDYAKHTKKALRSYLNIILFELERNHRPERPIERNTLGKSRVSRFRKLIEVHYKNKKSPSEYAFLLNITTNHLNKVCKQEVGKTAGTFIRNHLCIEARRLLYHTNYSISEIAVELGFKNVSYFSTFFKNQTGNTPEAYRKQVL